MKKFILITVAAVITLSASAQNLKFAHVNFNELVMLMPEADSARAQMEVSQKEAQDTYRTMVEEYQSKAQKYQQNSSTWTAAIRESKEKELADISNRIQEFDQSIQQELQQQQNELMAPIQQGPRCSSNHVFSPIKDGRKGARRGNPPPFRPSFLFLKIYNELLGF